MTRENCGIKRVKSPDDMISGHIEYETLTLCGEATCSDECWRGWGVCPYCGEPFVTNKPKEQEQKDTKEPHEVKIDDKEAEKLWQSGGAWVNRNKEQEQTNDT